MRDEGNRQPRTEHGLNTDRFHVSSVTFPWLLRRLSCNSSISWFQAVPLHRGPAAAASAFNSTLRAPCSLLRAWCIRRRILTDPVLS